MSIEETDLSIVILDIIEVTVVAEEELTAFVMVDESPVDPPHNPVSDEKP